MKLILGNTLMLVGLILVGCGTSSNAEGGGGKGALVNGGTRGALQIVVGEKTLRAKLLPGESEVVLQELQAGECRQWIDQLNSKFDSSSGASEGAGKVLSTTLNNIQVVQSSQGVALKALGNPSVCNQDLESKIMKSLLINNAAAMLATKIISVSERFGLTSTNNSWEYPADQMYFWLEAASPLVSVSTGEISGVFIQASFFKEYQQHVEGEKSFPRPYSRADVQVNGKNSGFRFVSDEPSQANRQAIYEKMLQYAGFVAGKSEEERIQFRDQKLTELTEAMGGN